MQDSGRWEDVLSYWFGELESNGMPAEGRQKLWFDPPPGTDEEVRSRFGDDVARALRGELAHWADSPNGLTALVLLLDQFTRNIHRGTPAAFSGDERALALAREAVTAGIDADMPTIHRVFLYIPFEHAEDLATQDEGVAHFDRLLSVVPESVRQRVAGFRQYAVAHRDVIARFGRFPHRNAILGRESTAEELDYLQEHGGF